MANIEALNDDVLEAAAGGRAQINTTDWKGAHWQPQNRAMGSTWTENGYNWYRIKPGDNLSTIAQRYGYTVQDLVKWNPKTIQNPNKIFAGDAIVLGLGHL